MYKGLHNTGRGKLSTGVEKYGLKNKVHTVQVHGVGAEEFYGPPRPGQSFSQYESFMQTPFYTASGVVIGAMVAGPIGAIVGGVGSWLIGDTLSKKSRPKSRVQGG